MGTDMTGLAAVGKLAFADQNLWAGCRMARPSGVLKRYKDPTPRRHPMSDNTVRLHRPIQFVRKGMPGALTGTYAI